MADRQVTYTITLDDQFTAPLKRNIAELRREFVALVADTRRDAASLSSGGSVGTLRNASAAPGSPRSPLTANSDSRETVSRLGLISRELSAIRQILFSIAGRSGGGFGFGGPGGLPVDPGRRPSIESRVERFVQGGMLSQLGHATGGGIGELTAGMGSVIQGFQAGGGKMNLAGVTGGAIGGGIALMQFAAARDAEMRAAAQKNAASRAEHIAGVTDVFSRREQTRSLDRSEYLLSAGVPRDDRQRGEVRNRVVDSALNLASVGHAKSEIEIARQLQAADTYGSIDRGGRTAALAGPEGQKLMNELLEREKVLRKELNVAQVENMDFSLRAIAAERQRIEMSDHGYRQQIAHINDLIVREQQRFQDQKADFGAMSKSDQRRTLRIDEKLASGGTLTTSELRFARGNQFLSEGAATIDAQRADEAGFGNLRSVSAKKTLSQLEGQRRIVDERRRNVDLERGDLDLEEKEVIANVRVNQNVVLTLDPSIKEKLAAQTGKNNDELNEMILKILTGGATETATRRALSN